MNKETIEATSVKYLHEIKWILIACCVFSIGLLGIGLMGCFAEPSAFLSGVMIIGALMVIVQFFSGIVYLPLMFYCYAKHSEKISRHVIVFLCSIPAFLNMYMMLSTAA